MLVERTSLSRSARWLVVLLMAMAPVMCLCPWLAAAPLDAASPGHHGHHAREDHGASRDHHDRRASAADETCCCSERIGEDAPVRTLVAPHDVSIAAILPATTDSPIVRWAYSPADNVANVRPVARRARYRATRAPPQA